MSGTDFERSSHGEHEDDGGGPRLNPRDTWVILFVIAALVLMLCFTSPRLSDAAVGPRLAQNTDLMKIVPPAGAAPHGQYDTPVYPTRTLAFTIQYDDTYYTGDTIQCRVDGSDSTKLTPVIHEGTWGSCGTPAPGSCPLSQCFQYTPQLSSNLSDDSFTVFTRLVDSNGDSEGGAGEATFDFRVDTTPPHTTLSIGYLHSTVTSPAGNGRHVSFRFSSDDDNATFQCALSSSSATPSNWKPCKTDAWIPFTLPATTRIYHFSVRAVDAFGRTDPSPPSYSFSPEPCRSTLLTRPRTLAALARKGMRVRVRCLTPAAWHFLVVPIDPLARKYEIGELGGYSALFKRAGGSQTITVKAFPLKDFPPAWTHRHLRVVYETIPESENFAEFGAPQKIPGVLAPS